MQTNSDIPDRSVDAVCAVGILAAVFMAAESIPTIQHPLGSDWGHYFTVAEFLWHPSPDIGYPDFRKPLYGLILGGLGESMGYLEAGQFLGRMSALVMVVAAGIGARALVGPWAGVAAAWTVSLMPLVLDGALWVNHYPLLGASCGLALAAGATVCRWGQIRWAILAGLAAGIAAALDVRGAVTVPAVGALVLMGGMGRGGVRWLLLILLFSGGVGGVQAHDRWVQRSFDVPQLDFDRQLVVQRKGVLEQIQQGLFNDPTLEAACAGLSAKPFDAEGVTGSCAYWLRTNSYDRLESEGHLPEVETLWLSVFVLLPMAWGGRFGPVRAVGASVFLFGLPLASVLAGMGWVTYFDRYLLPFGVLIAMAVPVALGRIAGFVGWVRPGLGSWLAMVAGIGGLMYAWMVWPEHTLRNLSAPETARSSEYHAGVFAQWTKDNMDPGDAMVDCAGLAVDSILLPSRIDYVRFPPGDSACTAMIQNPERRPGRTYLITMHRDLPENTGPRDLAFDRSAVAAIGWRPIEIDTPIEGYALWFWEQPR